MVVVKKIDVPKTQKNIGKLLKKSEKLQDEIREAISVLVKNVKPMEDSDF